MDALSETERAELLPGLQGWRLVEGRDAIQKRFTFPDFGAAFAWVARGALAAERMGHRPEWRNSDRTVDVVLTTHAAKGLTRRDVDLAQRMDQFAASLS